MAPVTDTIVTEVKTKLDNMTPVFYSASDYINAPNVNVWPFVGASASSPLSSIPTPLPSNFIIKNTTYPRFPEGIPYFTVLTDLENSRGELSAITIDAVSMDLGRNCEGATFKNGETYDFYIINLTEDEHPMHIHLVNWQVIGRFGIDAEKYRSAWHGLNGVPGPRGFTQVPRQLDVRPFRNTSIQPPRKDEEIFMDVIGVPANWVTIARIKISDQEGKPFPFDVKGSRYVWHCHILEHEDNEMMRWFCIE